jgi:hypothetical protein
VGSCKVKNLLYRIGSKAVKVRYVAKGRIGWVNTLEWRNECLHLKYETWCDIRSRGVILDQTNSYFSFFFT